jgi:hypothetical protein
MVPRLWVSLLLALFLPVVDHRQEAQHPSPLTLHQAVTIAREKNPQRQAALAERKAVADHSRGATVLVMFTGTGAPGNEPVHVFGSKLRQQRFTTADFALNLLNTPTAVNNFSTRFGTWNLKPR